jgi:hypothetical protein
MIFLRVDMRVRGMITTTFLRPGGRDRAINKDESNHIASGRFDVKCGQCSAVMSDDFMLGIYLYVLLYV